MMVWLWEEREVNEDCKIPHLETWEAACQAL